MEYLRYRGKLTDEIRALRGFILYMDISFYEFGATGERVYEIWDTWVDSP